MRLLFPLFLAVALGTFPVPSLRAQEPKQPQPGGIGLINDVDVTVTDLTEEKLNNPPKREIKFERPMTPVGRKLPKPDPKLLEQKYAAGFRLSLPANGRRIENFVGRDEEVAQLQFIGESSLLNPAVSSSSSMAGMSGMPSGGGGMMPGMPGRSVKSVGESIRRMIRFLPRGETLTKDERDFFGDPKTTGGMLNISPYVDSERGVQRYWVFSVLGATPEEAERRAKALLMLMDQGAFRPIQLEIFKKREPLCVQLRDQRRAIETAQHAISAVQDQLKSYVDFTPDMLSNLRVQQLQLDVDLAGVKARIAACDRLLTGNVLKAERRSQVEDLKVAAEIELSGFEARLTKSNEFIGKVKTKIDLLTNLSRAESSLNNARGVSESLERQIKKLDEAVGAYAPFPLVEDQIVVHPIEWTQ
jgi:hypothetical protein